MAFSFLFVLIKRPLEESRGAILALLPLTLLLFLPTSARSQATVQGTVTDESGVPLVGAQVQIVGTDQGAVTDADGRYQITGVPTGPADLQAVYLGYRTEARSATLAAGNNTVNFALASSPIELDAIVVTGTAGMTRRRAIGNAVDQISAEEVLEKAPVTDLAQLIQSRSPGTVVLPSSGTVGTGSALRLRGISSLTQGNEPLLYIDGVRVDNDPEAIGGFTVGGQAPSRINDINPENIESIEIIKGPAAATLYGTEASSGVIQIITKKGRAGETRWNAKVSLGTTDLENNDFPANFGVISQASFDAIPDSLRRRINVSRTLEEGNLLISQNPFDFLAETGYYKSYYLSASGGGEDFTFFTSGEYSDDDGPIPANFAKKQSFRANFQWTPTQVFDLAVSTGYTNNDIRLPNNDNNIFGFFGNVFLGNVPRVRPGFPFGEPFTPLDDVSLIESRFTNDRFTGSLSASLRPWPWLANRVIAGLDLNVEENFQFIPFGAVQNLNPRGQKDNVRQTVATVSLDYNSTATFDLTPDYQSATSFGLQITNDNVNTVEAFGRDFPAPGVSTVSAAGVTEGFETRIEDSTVGIYFQEQIGWRNRLFLTGAVRFDDSSAFGSDFDYETYPKVGASYVVSDADFFRVPFVNTLKLRAAYGFAGRQPAAFTAFREFEPTAIRGGIPTISPLQIGNPDLAPERSREVEVGFDASLWEDRLAMVLTYYDKVTEDALIDKIVAPSLGFPNQGVAQLDNVGEIQNSGWEFGLNGVLVDTDAVDYSFTLSLSTNENEVTSLGGEAPFPIGFSQRIVEGFPADGYWSLVPSVDAEGNVTLSDTMEFIGRSLPGNTGAFGSTVTLWNNLSLYALFDWKRDYLVDNNTRVFRFQFGSSEERRDPAFADNIDTKTLIALFQAGQPFLEEGDFVKLREISATYTLPKSWSQAFRASSSSVTVGGRNLYTWTDYSGVDPEVNVFGQPGLSRSDFLTVPQARRFLLSLNLNF